MSEFTFTAGEFERMTPYQRGYSVYMLGTRDDQPNVPDEDNPYLGRPGTACAEWFAGQFDATRDEQDGDD